MLDNIKEIFSTVQDCGTSYLVIFIIASLICGFCYILDEYKSGGLLETFSNWMWHKLKWFHVFIIVIIITSFGIKQLIPSTKQMALIYIVPKIINNKDVQKSLRMF